MSSVSGTSTPTTSRARTAARYAAMGLLPFVPAVVAGFVAPGVNSLLVVLACLCGLQATVCTGSVRWGGLFTAAMVGSIFVATLLTGWPLAAGAWMVVIAVGAGVAGRNGLMGGYALVGIVTGFVLLSPVPVDATLRVEVLAPPDGGLSLAVTNAVVAALAGGWAVLVTSRFPQPMAGRPREPLSRLSAVAVAVALAVATGASTVVVLEWYRAPVAAWLLLTLYVLVLAPDPANPARSILHKVSQRLLGTFAGALLAVVIATLVPQTTALHALGFASLAVAVLLSLDAAPGHYWRYVVFLTPAMVLFDSDAGTAVTAGELRVVFTVIAGAIATVLIAAAALVVHGIRRHEAAGAV